MPLIPHEKAVMVRCIQSCGKVKRGMHGWLVPYKSTVRAFVDTDWNIVCPNWTNPGDEFEGEFWEHV